MSSEQPDNNKELAEQKIPSPEKKLSRELFREPGESQEAYLWRSAEAVGGAMPPATNIEKMTEDSLSDGVKENIKQVVAQASLENIQGTRAREWSEEEWENFRNKDIGQHFIGNYSDSDGFDRTVRDRGFFRFNSGRPSGKRETYWNTLFFSFNTKETRELAKKMLDDKKVVLLGGGRSELGKELEANNIQPESITNVDPFVENPDHHADKLISVSASDKAFGEKVPPDTLGQTDEVWAEYSVPAYLQSEEEIQQLMVNIDSLLVPGGVARIWPVSVGGAESGNVEQRTQALYESVRSMVEESGYELVTYKACGRLGMNLIKPRETVKTTTDEEKIAEIMKKLADL